MTRRSTPLALALLLGSQLGCTVTAVAGKEDSRPVNACTGDDRCGQGESCIAGLCQSLNGQLEAVLLTATPDFESTLPRLTFVQHRSDLVVGEQAQDIVWPGAARVVGSLVLPDGHCYPEFVSGDSDPAILASKDGSLPLAATLTLRQRALGLPLQTYLAQTVAAPLKGYTFEIGMPSGDYDVYLVPPKKQRGTCVVPPQLFRNVPIGIKDSAYQFNLAPVSEMDLHILWPESSPSLTGWTADILEPLGGHAISTEVVLANPPPPRQGRLDYSVPLAYSLVTEEAESANTARDLLRLRPPADLVAPTVYFERSALSLLQEPDEPVSLTVFTKYPAPVEVRAQMLRKADGQPLAGTLTLVSKSIYGMDPGVFGSFQASVTVAEDGAVQVSLPPGKYAVQATPPVSSGEQLSMLKTEWDIPADTPEQFGKLLELSRTSRLTGQVRVPGAEAGAEPVPLGPSPFPEAFGEGPYDQRQGLFVPRPADALVDDSGRFVLEVDDLAESRVNVGVQAPEQLGFGWFVRPGVRLGQGDQDLGRVTLPLPAALSGRAVVRGAQGDTTLGLAVIRAYAYLDKDFRYTRDPAAALSIVQVAETRADADGAFRLLLPATIDDAR